MTYDPTRHHRPFDRAQGRRSIRLRGYDYASPGAYFVTICVRGGECLLGKVVDGEVQLSDFGRIAHDFWPHIPAHFPNVSIDTAVIMPNHSHVIIVINDPPGGRGRGVGRGEVGRGEVTSPLPTSPLPNATLGQIVAYYKYQTTKQINQIRDDPGTSFWQRNYYEHIIRNDREWNVIRDYIVQNPLKWAWDQDNPANARIKRR